jgi:alkylation response protein AidB-like acyl-CoA dehydrogenase
MANEDVAAFRARFREWVAGALPETWRDLTRGTPEEVLLPARRAWGERLHAGGWAGAGWPPAYGGLGLTVEHQVALVEEQVRAGAPEPLNSNGVEIFGPVLIRYGSEAQKLRYLPPMLAHRELWCQGFSEPQAGSDLAGLRTRAIPDGDGWLVRGQKVWTTYAHCADHCYLLVRTDPDAPRHAGISMMILDMDQPGVSVRPLRNIAGSSEFNEVFLDDARIEAGQLVGDLGQGWELAAYALSVERGLSFAERALKVAREFERLLDMVDGLASEDPGRGAERFAERLVDAFVRTRTLHALVVEIIDRSARGEPLGSLPSVAKLHWSESHQELLRLGLDVLGQRVGDPEHQDWVRAFLFSRGETIYGGTSEIQRNVIAKGLGLPSGRAA